MLNLDFLCMKAAQDMMTCEGRKSDKENVATKGLGVLLENGPYGLMLYLETYRNKSIARHYREHLLILCREKLVASYLAVSSQDVPRENDFEAITRWLRDLAMDLDRYLFAKRLWQQTLTYARYHAKALNDQPMTKPDDGEENAV